MRSTTLTVSQSQRPIKKLAVSSFWPYLISVISFPFQVPWDCSRSLLPSWNHPDLGCRPVYYAPCPPSPSTDWPIPSNSSSIHLPPIQATHGYQGKPSNPCWVSHSPAMGLRSSSAPAKLGPTECQLQCVFFGKDLLMTKYCLNSAT